jgi:hypothetical protein
VPVHFAVHVHRPIGVHVGVDGEAYYRAPGDAALVITKAPGIVGAFFHGTYRLDVVPQAWSARYHVTGVTHASDAGGPVTVLSALPLAGAGDIARVTFRIDDRTHAPVGASWLYTDGSTIVLTFANGPVGAALAPQSATIAVDMPKSKLEATVTYGAYAMNVPIDPSVFATT